MRGRVATGMAPTPPSRRPTRRRRNPATARSRSDRCRRIYRHGAPRDVTVVFAVCVTMGWRSDRPLYIDQARAIPHVLVRFTTAARGAGGDGEANPINLAATTKWSDAIRAFSPSACARSRRTSARVKASSPPTTRGRASTSSLSSTAGS